MNDSLPAEPVSNKVVAKVAAAHGVSPMDIQPPLYDTIDPNALDSLFADRAGTSRTGQVSFEYGGCDVTVGSDGHVEVHAPEKTIPDSE